MLNCLACKHLRARHTGLSSRHRLLSFLVLLCKDKAVPRNFSDGEGGFRWTVLSHYSRNPSWSHWLMMQREQLEGTAPSFLSCFLCSDSWEALEKML